MKKTLWVLVFFLGLLGMSEAKAATYERTPARYALGDNFSIHFSFANAADLSGISNDPDYGQGEGCGAPTNYIFYYSVYGTGDSGNAENEANDYFYGPEHQITETDALEAYSAGTLVNYQVDYHSDGRSLRHTLGRNLVKGIGVIWYNYKKGGTSFKNTPCEADMKWLEGDDNGGDFLFKISAAAAVLAPTSTVQEVISPTSSPALSNGATSSLTSSSLATLNEASDTQSQVLSADTSSVLFIDVSSSSTASTSGVSDSFDSSSILYIPAGSSDSTTVPYLPPTPSETTESMP